MTGPAPASYRAVLDTPATPATITRPALQAFTWDLENARQWATAILTGSGRAEGDRVLIYRIEETLAESVHRTADPGQPKVEIRTEENKSK